MRERGVFQNTVARAYGGLRCFFGFLSRERMIPQNLFQLVEKPRMEKKLIKPLSMDQARLLLAAIKTKRWTDHNLRTIMVLVLLFVSEHRSVSPEQNVAEDHACHEWTGVEFVRRVAALIPPPRKHVVRYYGALGPCSPLRGA